MHSLIARVSPEDIVVYANNALAEYLGVPKEKVVGSPLEVIRSVVRGEVAECFQRPERGRMSNRLVTDLNGRVFEAKNYSEGGVLDIVLDDVTDAESIHGQLIMAGVSHQELNEEELRTVRLPEKRFLTVGLTRLSGVSALTERLSPTETRLMVSAFLEEATDAIRENSSTVGQVTGVSVLAVHGAPRYYLDHALRAIKCACDQMAKLADLRGGFSKQGRELPPCSIGLASGEVLLGTLGDSERTSYTVIGSAVELGARLCGLARPGEILLTETTLQSALNCLPPGWQAMRAESEETADLSDLKWGMDDLHPVAPELRKTVYLVGPGVEENPNLAEFYFRYYFALNLPDHDLPVPVLSVVRPESIGSSVQLDDENVVMTQSTRMLGKYRLMESIGRGGMGQVWRAQDRFGNAVAIKVLNAGDAATDDQIKRFKREAEIMARLPHRNICRIYEINEFEDITYIAMEFVEGVSLADLLYEDFGPAVAGRADNVASLVKSIRDGRRSRSALSPEAPAESTPAPKSRTTRILPVEQTMALLVRICDAVQFAHEHGVLHRDLKPGNILIREDGEPLVVDFGLAKLETGSTGMSLSLSGHVVGTIENMAPEQAISSKRVDERADVFSLGTILYQMVTGRKYFDATGNLVTDAQVLQTYTPPRPRTINRQLDPDIEIITMKALRSDAAERYRSIEALRADLDRYRRGEVIAARGVTVLDLVKKSIQRNMAVSAVIAVSGLLLITMGIISLVEIDHRRRVAERALQDSEDQKRVANEARAQAELARIDAEERQEIANRNEQKAREQELLAKAAAERADDSLAKLTAAVKAAEDAKEDSRKANAETEQERAQTTELRQTLSEIEERNRDRKVRVGIREDAATRDENIRKAREAFMRAMNTVNLNLSPFELDRNERNPEEIVARLSQAMNQTCESLAADPSFFPAWLLKGRLHLTAMELESARTSFDEATNCAQGVPGIPDAEVPVHLRAVVDEVERAGTRRFEVAARGLRANGTPQDVTLAGVIDFLSTKPAFRAASPNNPFPLGRQPQNSEIKLSLYASAGTPKPEIDVTSKTDGTTSVQIDGAGSALNVAVLRNVRVTNLALRNAPEVDWDAIENLPLVSLDLSGSQVSSLPFSGSIRSMARLTSLNLANTGVSSLESLRGIPTLEALNVSATGVADLRPLAGKRLRELNVSKTEVSDLTPLAQAMLRELDISQTKVTSLQPVLNQPLEKLVLSPEAITDAPSLQRLRVSRTLRFIRSPADPDGQTAAEFWQKLDGKTPPAE